MQLAWMSGFAGAASDLGLPIRLDQALPSAHMASVAFPAMVRTCIVLCSH